MPHVCQFSVLSVHVSCPVCGQNLAELGTAEMQEAHVKACLEGPRGGSAAEQPVKYLVYRLPAESALIGVECVICLEEFVQGALEVIAHAKHTNHGCRFSRCTTELFV